MIRNRSVLLAGVLLVTAAMPAHAQFTVYDPANYAQAIARYSQMVQQYQFWLRQARRLPVDIASRYGVPEVTWRLHDLAAGLAGSRAVLSGLNAGDASGAGYRQAVVSLDALDAVLARVPASLQRRLGSVYTTIELADSVARSGIHQVGSIRSNGRSVLQTIRAMEQDLAAPADDFHSQTALLNKINGASVLGLRIAERTSQFLLHTLEQLLVDNKRKRDAEAQLMNAHIYQWRYGASVSADMFRNTASALDRWRQP